MKICIVGGSIGGLSAAIALRKEGCEVVVLERASKIVPAGARRALQIKSSKSVDRFRVKSTGKAANSDVAARPFSSLQKSCNSGVVDHGESLAKRTATPIIVNDVHNHRSFHWSDLHRLLYDNLPKGTVRFSHKVISYKQSAGSLIITAEASVESSGSKEVQFTADLLVAADGSNSTIRRLMYPEDKRRYAGMIAWRGVLMGDEHPELVERLHADFPNLHKGIIFDLSTQGGMNLIYMLPGNRVNWLWYRDSPEPDLVGHSVTVKATEADIEKLHKDAEATWTPAFVDLIKTTKSPFINAIFDKEPLQNWKVEDQIVLLGEAAHPTTPHGSRSTNMSLQDSFTLGQCYRNRKGKDFLAEFEKARISQTSQEVLFSRYVGELRQGRWVDTATFGWPQQSEARRKLLLNALRFQPDYKAHVEKELQCSKSGAKRAVDMNGNGVNPKRAISSQ